MIKLSIKIQKELGLSFTSILTRRSFASKKSDQNGNDSKTNKTENSVSENDIKEAKDKKPVVLVEKNDNVTLIGINRPEVRNCVNIETAKQLSEAISQFEKDDASPIAVLYGVGGTFCAGYDLSEAAAESAKSIMLRSEGAMGPTRLHPKKPLVAALNGYCVGGGLELALMCDLRVVEEDAILGFFNRRFGVPLVDGGCARLAHMIGLSRALDLVLTGRHISAKEAFDIGLANRLVAIGSSLGQALNLASSIAKFPPVCLKHDRDALFYAKFEAKSMQDAMQYEIMTCSKELFEEATLGATRFTEGIGRGGKFHDIRVKNIPEWERDEIQREIQHEKNKNEKK